MPATSRYGCDLIAGHASSRRSKSFAREAVAHERDHRSAVSTSNICRQRARSASACGMEALEIDAVVKRHRFGRIEAELVD